MMMAVNHRCSRLAPVIRYHIDNKSPLDAAYVSTLHQAGFSHALSRTAVTRRYSKSAVDKDRGENTHKIREKIIGKIYISANFLPL
jgi:hypothetical protein